MAGERATAPEGFLPYDTVPKDGRFVQLWASDTSGPFEMSWQPHEFNPLVSIQRGIWVLKGGGLTWCDDRPEGAPTHWRSMQ